MKRFISDIKKYWNYIKYQAKADIKTEVIDSVLGWAWIIIEPLCFMLIYTFIAGTIFGARTEYFPIFVYLGLTLWNFFNKTIVMSVRLVASNRDIVTKVYVPKFVLLIEKMMVNFVKLCISFSLVIIFMIIYRVPLTWNILLIIPILFVLIIVTFGFGTIFMHFGVFVEDLVNLTNIGMKVLFYLTGVFYSIITKMPAPYNRYILAINPMASLITGARFSLLHMNIGNKLYVFIPLVCWALLGLLLSIIGIRTIYKYENTYVKVMKH